MIFLTRPNRSLCTRLHPALTYGVALNYTLGLFFQALQWQVKQKTKEATDARNQLKLGEQRMNIETESIRKALTVSTGNNPSPFYPPSTTGMFRQANTALVRWVKQWHMSLVKKTSNYFNSDGIKVQHVLLSSTAHWWCIGLAAGQWAMSVSLTENA